MKLFSTTIAVLSTLTLSALPTLAGGPLTPIRDDDGRVTNVATVQAGINKAVSDGWRGIDLCYELASLGAHNLPVDQFKMPVGTPSMNNTQLRRRFYCPVTKASFKLLPR